MHSSPYISAIRSFVSEYSQESHSEFAKAPHGLGSLQRTPIPSKLDFDLVQELHPKTLVSIFCTVESVAAHFHLAMEQVTAIGNNDMPFHVIFAKSI